MLQLSNVFGGKKEDLGALLMADKIQKAYKTSKNIYDDVLTQGNIFSKLYCVYFKKHIPNIVRYIAKTPPISEAIR